jgi:two-component system sensor histidine kinase ChvG
LVVLALPVPLLLGLWLQWRLMRPMERLRFQALLEASAAHPKPALDLPRSDEFGDLAAAFNELAARLDDRNRVLERFVADLAHELKNPVAAVRAAGEALAQGPVDTARAQRLARAIGDAGRRLDVLVTELLELARAESGLRDERREPLDVAALVQGLVGALQEDERHAGCTFTVDAPATAMVPAVPGRVETALRNLLVNAATFAGAGGSVTVRVTNDVHSVHVAVDDSGPGVPKELRERIFERFFTTRPGQGTGLGLPLVRAVAEAHGGAVWVEPAPAGGARLVLELPR